MSNLTLLDLSEARANLRAAAITKSEISLEDPGAWADTFMGTRTASGKVVTREQAIRCSAVLSCIRILSEDIASLPLVLKKKTPTGAVDAVDHAGYRLLKTAPNLLQTPFELREHMMMDLLLTGYFFNWQKRNGVGRLVEIVPIPAWSMSYSRSLPDGTVVWSCGHAGFPSEFTNWNLWRGTVLNYEMVGGRALILLAREAIGLAMAAEEQGARLFSNGVQTDLTLQTDGELAHDDKLQLREAFMSRHAGSSNAFMPLLLENGLKAERIGLTAQESQYIEARQYQLADIARLFRMPGVMLGLSDKTNTFAAAEQFFQAYAKHTLGPWTRRIEETGSRDLLLEREQPDYFLKHDYAQLLQADQKTRFEAYRTAIDGGYMMPEEARAKEDWGEIPGLDYTRVPANYAIMRDGKLEPVPTAKGATDPTQTPDKPPANDGQTAAKLAKRTAETLVKSERRQFARTRVSESARASFAAWHLEKVMELTGARAEVAAAYSAWRLENTTAHDEATAKLITLSLEA